MNLHVFWSPVDYDVAEERQEYDGPSEALP